MIMERNKFTNLLIARVCPVVCHVCLFFTSSSDIDKCHTYLLTNIIVVSTFGETVIETRLQKKINIHLKINKCKKSNKHIISIYSLESLYRIVISLVLNISFE